MNGPPPHTIDTHAPTIDHRALPPPQGISRRPLGPSTVPAHRRRPPTSPPIGGLPPGIISPAGRTTPSV